MKNLAFCSSLVLMVAVATRGAAGEMSWGNLKVRFVYDGPPPERALLPVTRDKAYCGKFEIRDESLVVDKDGGLSNVVMWIDAKIAAPPVHPAYEKSAKDIVGIDNRNCRLLPHVALLRTTQTLQMRNSEPIANNARFDSMLNTPFNVLLPTDATKDFKLDKSERLPGWITCAIHPWKRAFLLVQDHPYMAVSDGRGHVELKHVPVGKWTFVFWHEKAGYLRSVERGGKVAEWPKGRAEIEIKPIANDLGEIKLKPEIFK